MLTRARFADRIPATYSVRIGPALPEDVADLGRDADRARRRRRRGRVRRRRRRRACRGRRGSARAQRTVSLGPDADRRRQVVVRDVAVRVRLGRRRAAMPRAPLPGVDVGRRAGGWRVTSRSSSVGVLDRRASTVWPAFAAQVVEDVGAAEELELLAVDARRSRRPAGGRRPRPASRARPRRSGRRASGVASQAMPEKITNASRRFITTPATRIDSRIGRPAPRTSAGRRPRRRPRPRA